MKFNVEKHLTFKIIEQKPKTSVYSVYNEFEGNSIGFIRWNTGWRHYCFYPLIDTVFSDRCLLKIGEFVSWLNENHKKKKGDES